MPKRKKIKTRQILPIEDWLIPDIFSFGEIKGWSRIFLSIELFFAVLVVIGTCTLLILRF